jgi:hypothetical protein
MIAAMSEQLPTRIRRAAVAVAPLFLLAALIAGLAIGVHDRRLLLDYVRALTWPTVVAVSLWWLREPLRLKIAQLLELSAMGATARFDEREQATQELEDSLADAMEVLGPEPEPESEAPAQQDANVEGPVAEVGATAPEGKADATPEKKTAPDPALTAILENTARDAQRRERERREAMESVIRESAAWGFDMAHLGFTTRPIPVIEWDHNGRPAILYGTSKPPSSAPVPRQIRTDAADATSPGAVKRLEREIQQLELERDRQSIFPSMITKFGTDEASVRNKQIQRLKERLRRIDPASPYA